MKRGFLLFALVLAACGSSSGGAPPASASTATPLARRRLVPARTSA
jgi:hypothetical protein